MNRAFSLFLLSILFSCPAYAKYNKFRVNTLGTFVENTRFCQSKGHDRYSGLSGKTRNHFYVLCSDAADPLEITPKKVPFFDHSLHILKTAFSVSASATFTPVDEFISALDERGQIMELPLINDYNRNYIALDPNVRKSFAHLVEPFNVLFREFLKKIYSTAKYRENEIAARNSHYPELVPVAESFFAKARELFRGNAQHEAILSHLENEFRAAQQFDHLTLEWARTIPSRLLAAQSYEIFEASQAERTLPEEVEIYQHAFLNQLSGRFTYPNLFKKDLWKNGALFITLQDQLKIPDPDFRFGLDYQKTREQIAKASNPPEPTYAFAFGQTIVNPIMLCQSYLHYIFPLSVPKTNAGLGAHGVRFTPYGFYFHDIFHAEIFSTNRILSNHIYDKAKLAYEKGLAAEDIIRRYGPIAAQRYQGLLNLFQVFLDTGMLENSTTDPKVGSPQLSAFKLAVAGLFEGLHEFPSLSSEMLDMDSPLEIVNRFVKETKKKLIADQNWESPTDPLQTSALNGSTQMTDDQILQAAFQSKSDPEVKTIEIQRTRRFIDLILFYRNNSEYRISFPTYFHKLTNSEDNYSMLYRYARVERLKELHDLAFQDPGNHEKVESYLTELRKELVLSVDAFGQYAKEILLRKVLRNGTPTTLNDVYQRWVGELKKRN